jgi:hypothetical protein
LLAETREYLDHTDELLRTESNAVDCFKAKIERYPRHLARTVLWVNAHALYGVPDRPGDDIGHILISGWL